MIIQIQTLFLHGQMRRIDHTVSLRHSPGHVGVADEAYPQGTVGDRVRPEPCLIAKNTSPFMTEHTF